jgi:drug/metabolite transporter (DMT)-like permease
MLVAIIVPVFAIILDGILLSQFVTGSDLFGFALMAIGVFIMDERLNHILLRKG